MKVRVAAAVLVVVLLVALAFFFMRPGEEQRRPSAASCATFAGCSTQVNCYYYGFVYGWRCYGVL